MSDPLSMSLDQIIEKNSASSRAKEGRKSRGGGGGGNKVARSVRTNGKKQFSDRPKTARSSFLSRDTDEDFGASSRPGSAPKLIYRPIKIGGSSTQKATFQPSSSVAAVTTSSAVAKPTGSTVFSRLGKQPSSGSKVVFTSLVSSVEPADMEELCKTVGEIKDITIKASWSGQKTAEVVFARRSDAINCVGKFNGLTLDGVNMVVELAEEAAPTAPKTIFDRIATGTGLHTAAKSAPAVIAATATAAKTVRNNKEGLFGTSLNDDDDQEMQQEPQSTNFSVTFGGSNGSRLKQPTAAGGRTPFGGHRSVTAEVAGARGAPRGGRGRAGRPGSSESGAGKPKGREVGLNLDDDLDTYMKKR